MQGRYEAQSYELTSQLNVDNPGQPMRYETRTTGRRIGECAAKK
jgi:hypothetical protein